MIKGTRSAPNSQPVVESPHLIRVGFLVPMWQEGILHVLVCKYQGELSLPAVEVQRNPCPWVRAQLSKWIASTFEPATCSWLLDLLEDAPYVAPVRDRTLPCYFVAPCTQYPALMEGKPSSHITLIAQPLQVGAALSLDVEADSAFCQRYLAYVARDIAFRHGSGMWRFYKLDSTLDGKYYNPGDASYVQCSHGWVLLKGTPDGSIQPICKRSRCQRVAHNWYERSRSWLEAGSPAEVATATSGDGLPRIGSNTDTAEGDALFCDTLSDIIEAERRIAADIATAQPPVLALDLEGNLGGPRPHMALMQIKSPSHCFVIDTHVVAASLSPRGQCLRSFITDGAIVKVVHCCYGDAGTLRTEHSATLACAFDTGIADSVLYLRSPNSSRGLGTVLMDWLPEGTVHLTHKGKLVHVPFMFNKRPLSLEHFVYSAEDVENCIELFNVMSQALRDRGLLELVFALSDDRCSPDRPEGRSKAGLAIAIVDSVSVVCIENVASGELELPSSSFDPRGLQAFQARDVKEFLREAWVNCMGAPASPSRLSAVIGAQLRIPKRVGSMYLSYGILMDLEAVLPLLEQAFATGALALTHRVKVVPRLELSAVPLLSRTAHPALFQCIHFDTLRNAATPRQGGTALRRKLRSRSATCIQRVVRGRRDRLRLRRIAATCAAASNTSARGALVVFDSTHAYVLKGATPDTPWKFPWSTTSADDSPFETALAGFDRYAGPAARKGLPAELEDTDASADTGWCLMPRTASRLQTGLASSTPLGHQSKGSLTCFTACYVKGLVELAAAFVASRHERNGFRLSPTEHKRHPVAALAAHATALQYLHPEDAWALRQALSTIQHRGDARFAIGSLAVPAGEVSIGRELSADHEWSRSVIALQRVFRGRRARRALLMHTEIDLPSTATGTCASDNGQVASVEPTAPTGRVAMLFDKYVQLFDTTRSTALAFGSAAMITDMLGYADTKRDKIASRIQGEIDTEIAVQLDAEPSSIRDATPSTPSEVDLSRHSGTNHVPILSGIAHEDVEEDRSMPVDTNKVDKDSATAAGVPSDLPMPTLEQIADAQRTHPATAPYFDYLLTGLLPEYPDSEQLLTFKTEAACLYLSQGEGPDATISVLRRYTRAGVQGPILLPALYRAHVFQTFHDKQGHLGVSKIWPSLRRLYWWPKARDELRAYIKLCRICRRLKVPHHGAGAQHMTHHGSTPWSDVTFDVYDVGWTSEGYSKVVSFNDHLGRGVLCAPLRNDYTAEDIADIIVNYVLRFKGRPLRMHSDRGSTLIAEIIEQLYAKYQIHMEAGMAYNHNSAALTERWNSTLKALLSTHRLASQDDRWHLYLPLLELAYNSTVNQTTGFAPFFVEHLRHADIPSDLTSGRPHHGAPTLPIILLGLSSFGPWWPLNLTLTRLMRKRLQT